MRWFLRMMALGLLAGAFTLPGANGAFDADKKPGGKGSGAETCGDYGTSLHFEKTPKEAAKRAAKEEKLVFVVHVSGIFEETDFT